MHQQRPNPDQLLARVQAAEAAHDRATLKVFFGMAAGVGKTYAMLEAARERRAAGVDVVVGYVEPHGRAETEALLAGLERIPTQRRDYRGTAIEEFDLDAVLARRPTLVLVDELAHTNAPGSRHPKRWQDVEELLQAGIDVYTTVNVQHLESLNDVVAQITGVIVRETVPDHMLERADEVELIDLPPDELLQRLRAGKVYVPHQAASAAANFFRKGNLIALRELALRRTADRVDSEMQHYRRDHAIPLTWPTAERILVCVSANALAARLVRATRRMAAALRAQWLVVYVETAEHARLGEAARDRVLHTLQLAEQLGAEVVTLSGHSVGDVVLEYAHVRNVSKIVVGKPAKARWQELCFGSVVDELVRKSGAIDVYVISGEHDDTPQQPAHAFQRTSPRATYGQAALVVALCSALAALIFPVFEQSNLIMVYLLGVVLVATRYGRGPSILASLLSVAAFDFLFVPPYYTFAVSDTQYVVTFLIMLLVAMVISTLTVRLRQQASAAQQRERRTAALYAMSREFARTRGRARLLEIAAQHIEATFDSRIAILAPEDGARLTAQAGDLDLLHTAPQELGVAQWAYDHREAAGLGTHTLAGAGALHLPLVATDRTMGVVVVRPREASRGFAPEQFHLLETFANQTALALERARLAEQAEAASVQAVRERVQPAPRMADTRTTEALPSRASTAAAGRHEDTRLPTYLELLIDDARLVPLVDGLPLQFVTLMNSSFVSGQQLYQFRHPSTGAVLTYAADELKQAIGRAFAPVDLIPANPARYVQQQRNSRHDAR